MHELEMRITGLSDSILSLSGEIVRCAQKLSDDDRYTMPLVEIDNKVEKIDEVISLLEGAKQAIKNCKK